MPYETEQRLKSYLDTNQEKREQLCRAVLALDRRFTDLRPRHPRGGPDGGRDIEGTFAESSRAFGAVGFLNQANDSGEQKKEITKKFEADLARALEVDPDLGAFVFMTNVALTVGEKDGLEDLGRRRGLKHCEVFDRERLRIALDDVDGLSVRFQYLGIPLSEAEQASFFAKWGDQITEVIGAEFADLRRTLERVLFLQEVEQPLKSLTIFLELDRMYQAKDIGHFRAYCYVLLKEPRLNKHALLFGSSDKSDRVHGSLPGRPVVDLKPGIKHGISGGQWESVGLTDPGEGERVEAPADKFQLAGSSASVGVEEVRFLALRYSRDSLVRFEQLLQLRDLNDAMYWFYVNRSLGSKVKAVHIYANEYKLAELEAEQYEVRDHFGLVPVPLAFSPDELTDPWAEVRPREGSFFTLSFDHETPRRRFTWRIVKDSLPIA